MVEGMGGGGETAPLVNVGTRQKYVVAFRPGLLYPRGKISATH